MNVIHPRVVFGWMRDFGWGDWLGPFLNDIGSTRRGPVWPWHKPESVEAHLDHTWRLLGKWQARRAVSVDRATFDRAVPKPVRALSSCLNDHRLASLSDFERLTQQDYATVISEIQRAVIKISRVKPTTTVSPMFGSKVLHHFFPSVVPVFDDRMIRKGAMRSSAFAEFLNEDNGWLLWSDADSAGSAGGLDFHRWIAFCGEQIVDADPGHLEQARQELGEAIAPEVSPAAARPASILWRLDAKLAEFCATGQACDEGILP